ncbi:MAG: hypothetical protein ABL985_20270, partial [Casimicrobium sp.]
CCISFGGFGGGAGADYSQTFGGFGGGGANPKDYDPFASRFHGGFGGGGGGGARGGFGAGDGDSLDLRYGGGGLGAGGAIFVVDGGQLEITGALHIAANAVTPGISGGGGATNGSAFGSGIFLQGPGSRPLLFTPGYSDVVAISNSIADQTGSGGAAEVMPGGPYSLGYSGQGAVGLELRGAGQLVLDAANTFSGGLKIVAGRVLAKQRHSLGRRLVSNDSTLELADAVVAELGTASIGEPDAGISYQQGAFGRLTLHMTGTECSLSKLVAVGSLRLAGTLEVQVANGCMPPQNGAFVALQGSSLTQKFSQLHVTGMPSGRSFYLRYSDSLVEIEESAVVPEPLNIDGSDLRTKYSADYDGVILMRYLLGFRGESLLANGVGAYATRSVEAVTSYIETLMPQLDVDGDGATLPGTDGLLILRYLQGARGSSLVNGILNSGLPFSATEIESIEANLRALTPFP